MMDIGGNIKRTSILLITDHESGAFLKLYIALNVPRGDPIMCWLKNKSGTESNRLMCIDYIITHVPIQRNNKIDFKLIWPH